MLAKFEQLLREIRHGQPSNTKYRDFERFLAGILDVEAVDVYTAHVARQVDSMCG